MCYLGEGGIGKSSSVAKIAMDWVEGEGYLSSFDFAFLLSLHFIHDNGPIEHQIFTQHGMLNISQVSVGDIRAILHGKVGSKVLLLLDGFDEYKTGTNEDIDAAIMNGIGNCLIILTSRPGDHLKSIKHYFDAEIKILGLSKQNIEKCATQYLGNREWSADLLEQCSKNQALSDLLHIPILLLMICSMYMQNKTLPHSITEIIGNVVQMTISRTTLKTIRKTARDVEELEFLLQKLGKLAWSALQKGSSLLIAVRLHCDTVVLLIFARY